MKTILITGGGRGLGKATAIRLASLGHRVLLTARDDAAGERTVREICAANPTSRAESLALELSRLEEVRAFGTRLAAMGLTLDVLLHVAGVMQTHEERQLTEDGGELTFTVNALAPFLLTSTLWPALQRSAHPRVITVSSRLHLPDSRGRPVDFDFDDPHLTRGYNPERAYKNSKLAVLWFTREFARRTHGTPLTVNSVCPGFVPKTAAASTKGFQHWLMTAVLPHLPFARSVDEAVDSFTFMALDRSLEHVSGQFYGEQEVLEPSPEARDDEKARRFWELAMRETSAAPMPR